jgi:hypothetical protein
VAILGPKTRKIGTRKFFTWGSFLDILEKENHTSLILC